MLDAVAELSLFAFTVIRFVTTLQINKTCLNHSSRPSHGAYLDNGTLFMLSDVRF